LTETETLASPYNTETKTRPICFFHQFQCRNRNQILVGL